jgi:uncharacterized protein YlxP (DUF503 family)
MDPASNTPIIILKSEEHDQAIPIWIGLLEATSIASALQNIKYERPMTHDLFKNISDTLHISITKVEVCDLKDSTFYARIYFVSKDSNFDIDARPSDAIALALRFNDQKSAMVKPRCRIPAKKAKNGRIIWRICLRMISVNIKYKLLEKRRFAKIFPENQLFIIC